MDWIVAIDGKNSIGSGAEMLMSFPSHQPLGLGIAVRGLLDTRSPGIAAKLHEVLEVKKKARACTYIVEFGYMHCGS